MSLLRPPSASLCCLGGQLEIDMGRLSLYDPVQAPTLPYDLPPPLVSLVQF